MKKQNTRKYKMLTSESADFYNNYQIMDGNEFISKVENNRIQKNTTNIKFHKECKLVIFDLDNTLMMNFCTYLAQDGIDIINYFKNHNIKIALASLNTKAEYFLKLHNMEHLFDTIIHRQPISHYWKLCKENKLGMTVPLEGSSNQAFSQLKEYHKLSSLDKTYMLNKILSETDTKAENALFFDDNIKHYEEATKLEIKTVHVNHVIGITWNDVKDGLGLFNKI